MEYTKELIQEAISFWKEELNAMNEDLESAFRIPDSEWKKVQEYIKKGSDFKAVGAACRSNPLKQKSRCLILKALGLNLAAEAFIDGLSRYISYEDAEALKDLSAEGIEIPAKYLDLAIGKEGLAKQYASNRSRFLKAHASGPLKALALMGIDYFTLYSDGSGSAESKAKAALMFPEGIPTYSPSYRWVGNSGLRWDVPLVVFMENGKMKGSGKNYFGYVAHTLESGSANPGYSVFEFNDKGMTYADADCNTVVKCMKWIQSNVLKDIEESETMKTKYTKKQIQEAISYWKKQLDESIGDKDMKITSISIAGMLEQVGVFDAVIDVAYGCNSSPSIASLSEEATNEIENLVSNDLHRNIKSYYACLCSVADRESYLASGDDGNYEDYEDYVDDEMFRRQQGVAAFADGMFEKPAGIKAFENCTFDGKPCTLIIFLYSFN